MAVADLAKILLTGEKLHAPLVFENTSKTRVHMGGNCPACGKPHPDTFVRIDYIRMESSIICPDTGVEIECHDVRYDRQAVTRRRRV